MLSMAGRLIPIQPTLGIVHGDLRLVCGCSAMETHFMKLLTNSYRADVASRGSLELCSECCLSSVTIFTRYALQHSRVRSLSLCGLPLCGSAIVAPRSFYFTITALIVDRGSSSRTEIWRNVASYDGATLSHLSSSVRPFYCQCLSMVIACLCARFYTPVSSWCGWNSQIHSFEGVSTYFVYI